MVSPLQRSDAPLSFLPPLEHLSGSDIWDLAGRSASFAFWAFLYIAPFAHLFFPRYSPFLQDCKEYNEAMRQDLRQGNPREYTHLNTIRTCIDDLVLRVGFQNPIALLVKEGGSSLVIQGISGLPKISSPVIVINKKALALSPEELEFALAAEVSSITSFHSLQSGAMIALSICIRYLTLPLFAAMTAFYSFAIGLGVLFLSIKLLSMHSIYLIKKSDLQAVRILGRNDGALRLLEREKTERLAERAQQGFFSPLINEEGELIIDPLHPSLRERRSYILQSYTAPD